jgi:hypothetical protein
VGQNFVLTFFVANANPVEIGIDFLDVDILEDDTPGFLAPDDFLANFSGPIMPTFQIAPFTSAAFQTPNLPVPAAALNAAIETFLGIDLEGDLEPFARGTLRWFEKPDGERQTTPFTATEPIPEPTTISLFAIGILAVLSEKSRRRLKRFR